MPTAFAPPQRRGFAYLGVTSFALLAIAASLAAAVALNLRHATPLLEAANKLGPAAQSLIEGKGLAICYGSDPSAAGPDAMCLHAQRMPLAPATLAAAFLVFRQHTLPAVVAKTLLFLLPVLGLFALAWKSLSASSPAASSPVAHRTVFLLFALPFLPLPTLTLAANLNFEEAYFYSWLALAVGLLLFARTCRLHPYKWALGVWLSLALTYLTKSSMLPATGFLALMAVAFIARSWRRPALAVTLLLASTAVPLAWGAWQHHVSGRFTVGTSLDGVNLYKGNNAGVLALYPAFRGASLDTTEASLFEGNITLDSDWVENDYALAQARLYIRAHPADTLRGAVRKASVFFLGVQRDLGEEPYPRLIELDFDAGLLLFRLMLFAALAFALRNLFAASGARFPAIVFLGCVAFTALPYIAGFALTRHSLVLILPTAAYLASLFVPAGEGSRMSPGNASPRA